MKIIHFSDFNNDIINFIVNKNNSSFDYSGEISDEKRAMLAVMNKAFSYLTTEEKELLKMKYVDCLNNNQIAEHFNRTSRNIRYRINKIMQVDLTNIINALLLNYKEILSAEESQIFEYYKLYRYTAKKISKILEKDIRNVQHTIQIIDIKLKIEN
ncbi:hypothetical protein [uncultured Thomasclavelia sp.]|uniref:hypothetical protein n=1 Tax=uncultured Thomasclavelia sp. TaxID=3025759 RepID=UPI00280B3F33|nr:hypothetical protein [uncultured Thomasclavelia sp.]